MAKNFNIKNAKPLLYLGGIGLLAFGGYKIYKKFEGDPNAKKTVDTFAAQAKTLTAQGQTPSFTDAEYGAIADDIYAPMAHSQPFSFIDDPYQPVYDGLEKMNNDLDIANLITKFGTRERDYFGNIARRFTDESAYICNLLN